MGAGLHLGRVESFDAARGLGTVTGGGLDLPFHCTAISDGTRSIDVGTAVAFTVAFRLGGSREADVVAKLPHDSAAPLDPADGAGPRPGSHV